MDMPADSGAAPEAVRIEGEEVVKTQEGKVEKEVDSVREEGVILEDGKTNKNDKRQSGDEEKGYELVTDAYVKATEIMFAWPKVLNPWHVSLFFRCTFSTSSRGLFV